MRFSPLLQCTKKTLIQRYLQVTIVTKVSILHSFTVGIADSSGSFFFYCSMKEFFM